MCIKVETKAFGVRTANSAGREARGEAAAFCLESLRRCLEKVCFPERNRVLLPTISVGSELLPFLHKKRTRVFRDDSLFPGALIIFNIHVEHQEKLENSSKLCLLPFLSFLFSFYPVHVQLSACLFAPPLLCGC